MRVAAQGTVPHDGSHEGIDGVVHRVDLARAWARLSDAQQETLALTVLDAAQAAAVLGISPVAFRLRLSRARPALHLRLDHSPSAVSAPAGPTVRSTP